MTVYRKNIDVLVLLYILGTVKMRIEVMSVFALQCNKIKHTENGGTHDRD